MDAFKFIGRASIVHLNTRKEGPDDAKELAVDLKLKAECSLHVAVSFDPLLSEFVFTDMGAVRNIAMGPITFNNELDDYCLRIFTDEFLGVAVKKFVFEPQDGHMFTLTFSVSFKPSGIQVARIAEFLQDEIAIDIAPATEELFAETAA